MASVQIKVALVSSVRHQRQMIRKRLLYGLILTGQPGDEISADLRTLGLQSSAWLAELRRRPQERDSSG